MPSPPCGEQGATLMITVDCGITGNEEVAFANSIGMDVVVTDHHECKGDTAGRGGGGGPPTGPTVRTPSSIWRAWAWR